MEVQASDAGWQARACGNLDRNSDREFEQSFKSVALGAAEQRRTMCTSDDTALVVPDLVVLIEFRWDVDGNLGIRKSHQQTIACVQIPSNREVT